MFVKVKEKQTLEENFQEPIKVKTDLAFISSHPGIGEDKDSTSKKNGKKGKGILNQNWRQRIRILQIWKK